MKYFIEPEVAGGFGDKTILDNSTHPPKVSVLNYEFDGWLGDDILETFPCFIVTERLMIAILNSNMTGIFFSDVIITKSVQFLDLCGDKALPVFYWAQIIGEIVNADFIIASDFRLCISQKAFDLLNQFSIFHASFEEYF